MWNKNITIDMRKLENFNSQEKEEYYFKHLPIFVSIPRSGCNWLQSVMEVYFNRHRVVKAPTSPSWMTTPLENPLWVHTHDVFHGNINVTTNNPVIFLYRDPVDVIYSMSQLFGSRMTQILSWCEQYKKTYEKWMTKKAKKLRGNGPVLHLEYDFVLNNKHDIMKKISHHFGFDFDLKRSKYAFNLVGNKKNVNEKNGINQNFKNPNSITEQYAIKRLEFRNKYQDLIMNKIFQEKQESINDLNADDFWKAQ